MKKKIILLFTSLFFTFSLVSCYFGMDEKPEDRAAEFVPVDEIIGIPTGGILFTEVVLTATVIPADANYKIIEWSITNWQPEEEGDAVPTLYRNRLNAAAYGTVTVTATIKNGRAEGEDYTQDFPIIIAESIPAVKTISGIASRITMGKDYLLNGWVTPSDAVNTTIVWSVRNAGTTGAAIVGNTLTTTSNGTALITATIAHGLVNRDYVQVFPIAVTKNVYAAGDYFTPSGQAADNPHAGYWKDEEFFLLPIPGDKTISHAKGIVFAGAGASPSHYIAGEHASGSAVSPGTWTACYWVDGERHDLAAGTALSIAADVDGAVYISTSETGGICFWKITGGTAEKLSLTGSTYTASATTGRFAVNNGVIYMAYNGSAAGGKSYYWDTKENPITRRDIDLGGLSTYYADDIAIVNGKVYVAGSTGPSGQSNTGQTFYAVMGEAGYTLLDDDAQHGRVNSIVAQNGSPWFYGNTSSSTTYYWDAAGNRTSLDIGYVTSVAAFSDGFVYIHCKDGSRGLTGGYSILGGEYEFRQLFGYSSGGTRYRNVALTGIALP